MQVKEKILITGGSGFIGKHLTKLLIQEGFDVVHVSRTLNSKTGVKTFVWDFKRKYVDPKALENVSYIIHLAGAGIADKPWTYKRKKEIVTSRIEGIPILLEEVKKQNLPLKAFISASGINYYGTKTSEKIFTEDDSVGEDYLAQTCLYWENYADRFKEKCRVVKLRTGVVFGQHEGALQKMKEPFRYGLGTSLGTGSQYMPWIHIDDLCNMYLHAIKNNIEGSFNACNPQHITNKELSIAIAKSLNKKLWLPNVPKFVLKLIFGEMADMLLEGSRCSSEKILSTGFEFKYSDIEKAIS